MKKLVFICLVLISCEMYNDEIIKAVILKTELRLWRPTGFSSKPLLKREVYINYLIDDTLYHANFISNDNMELFIIGDTVLIQTTDNPKEIKVLSEN